MSDIDPVTLFRNAKFRLSTPQLKGLPPDKGAEVAFVGRSNAGKSSALNRLTDQKALARTSKTPGRTQQIVVFDLDDDHRLIDLPGYGYAKVPINIRQEWQRTMGRYLGERLCLKGLVMLMDIRHPAREGDLQMLQWCRQAHMLVHILLTKADKLSRGRAMGQLQGLRHKLDSDQHEVSLQLFSASTGLGVDEARDHLASWLQLRTKKDPGTRGERPGS